LIDEVDQLPWSHVCSRGDRIDASEAEAPSGSLRVRVYASTDPVDPVADSVILSAC
jgi:hypothetical protein